MKTSYISVILALIANMSLSSIASAAKGIPSFGLQTALQFRSDLPDSAFRVRFQDGALNHQTTFQTRSATLANFPVLVAQNVQSALTEVFVHSGTAFLRHSHPRSSEVIYVLRGAFRVPITFEGTDPRVVTVDVKKGEATVFPQGLIHELKCICKKDCAYVAVFTSADREFVSAPTS